MLIHVIISYSNTTVWLSGLLYFQGVQAQTVANFYLAFERDLPVIPVINKIDLPNAQPTVVARQLHTMFDIHADDVLKVDMSKPFRWIGFKCYIASQKKCYYISFSILLVNVSYMYYPTCRKLTVHIQSPLKPHMVYFFTLFDACKWYFSFIILGFITKNVLLAVVFESSVLFLTSKISNFLFR